MEQQTFDEKGENKQRKERTEWLRLWCENTDDNSLPRVALIGDSITEQVFRVVQRELQGVACVDYLATSYSLLSSAYIGMVDRFIKDSQYSVVCYNYGLHGYNIDIDSYENGYREMMKRFLETSKVVISLTTQVLDKENLDKPSKRWESVVKERNIRAIKIAEEVNIPINDMYSLSVKLGKEGISNDGVHFNEMGIEELGKSKAESIKKVLK